MGSAGRSLLLILCFCLVLAGAQQTLRVAVLLPNSTSYLASIPRVGPAVELATSITGHKWDVIYLDSNCSAAWGLFTAIQGITKYQVNLFLGPVCDFVAAPIGRILKYWGVPLITAGAFARDYGYHKTAFQDEYFLVTRVGLTFNGASQFLLSVFELLGDWKRAVMFYDEKARSEIAADNFCTLYTKGVIEEMRNRGGYLWQSDKLPPTVTAELARKALIKFVGVDYAVVVMCLSPDATREVMLAAEDLQMIDSGEYVFFSVELLTSKVELVRPWYRAWDTETNNTRARKAYEALFTLTTRVPETPDLQDFSSRVKEIAREQFGFEYGADEQVNQLVVAFYEGILLYACALNESVEAGYTANDGVEVTRRMWNRTFEGISGTVSIDGNGDRTADYSLLAMNYTSGTFDVVVQYSGHNRTSTMERDIIWPLRRSVPPPDTPLCGYDKSKCPKNELPQWGIVSGVLAGALVVLVVVSFYIYRHFKLEAELASMTWRIPWEDLNPVSTGTGLRSRKMGSKLSIARVSFVSSFSGDGQFKYLDLEKQLYTRTALYKGVLVSVKPILKSRIILTRPLLLQLKKLANRWR